jgi:hypothetical protein
MLIFGCALGLATTSCSLLKPPPPAVFDLTVLVESDRDRPLAGATVANGVERPSSTAADGKLNLRIHGREGESVDLPVQCPLGYVASPNRLTVWLRRASKTPEYTFSCPPAERHLVVALRTDAGQHLPVSYLGRTIGYTDANGAFTHLFSLQPGDKVELQLDTTRVVKLRPANPVFSTVMKSFDDVVTFEQRFTHERATSPPGPGPHGPVNMWGNKQPWTKGSSRHLS